MLSSPINQRALELSVPKAPRDQVAFTVVDEAAS